ncbi:helix-turn-helix domain-containing protein [Acetobacter estunensis]|uniref:helix-turn-helix domain-containing protein n=1 Tax=Acetobacter estunensis TaxID=104097 RepID=UPI001C2CD9D1|nr:XRE family transcriptional regulator [Acetobacter estunensis]MBV1835748.1 XRE family transcriptional regulator [Acetobacter estunensis]MBV1835991.1 XRE family transcriptional regulator [Acetobacter estunensis]
MTKQAEKFAAPQCFDSVWDAICDTTEEAENMKLRTEVMAALERFVKDNGLTQVRAAAAFGVTQPRVSDLMRRKFDRFSLDSLLAMATRAGLRAHITLQKAAA